MSIVLQSSGGGSVTLQEPSTASNVTVTIPATTGAVMVSGNMPAFSAYQSSPQTLASNTNTKVTFEVEEFDTASCFASSKFTPNVAGYYQFSTAIQIASTATPIILSFYKNGSLAKRVGQTNPSSVSLIGGSALISCNGSTDYIEVYAQITTGQALDAEATRVYFQGVLVRTA